MSRRGAALPATLLAMAVAGALASAALAVARLSYLRGYRQLALAAASAAASGSLAWWRAELGHVRWTDSLAIGQPRALPQSLPLPRGLRTSDSVVRLSRALLLIRSTGERLDADGAVLARERLESILRIGVP